jgi:hypothetical protein
MLNTQGCYTARRRNHLPRSLADLEDLGTVEGENLSLAHVPKAPLDERSASQAWTRSKERVLHLQSNPGDNRPPAMLLSLCARGLVPHLQCVGKAVAGHGAVCTSMVEEAPSSMAW